MSMERTNLLAAIIIGSAKIPPESRKKLLKTMMEDNRTVTMLMAGDVTSASNAKFRNSELALQQVYETLAQHGVIGDTDPELVKNHE